jgi:hypothetical protein
MCYKSEDWLGDEDIHPDYIHLSLMDEVKVATTIAYVAMANNLSLPYSNSAMYDPMGP